MKKNLLLAFVAGILLTTTTAFYVGKNFSSPAPICYDYSTMAPNKMNKTVVLDMLRNYYNKQYAAIKASPALMQLPSGPNLRVDSRCVFFNLDTLKRLVYYIEKSAQSFNATTKANLGVNVYFASYPKQQNVTINGYNYTNRHTLVFVPAVFGATPTGNMMARDFDMLQNLASPLDTLPKFITTAMLSSPSMMFFGAMNGGSSSSSSSMGMQNHGSTIPPPFSPTTGTEDPMLDITDPY